MAGGSIRNLHSSTVVREISFQQNGYIWKKCEYSARFNLLLAFANSQVISVARARHKRIKTDVIQLVLFHFLPANNAVHQQKAHRVLLVFCGQNKKHVSDPRRL